MGDILHTIVNKMFVFSFLAPFLFEVEVVPNLKYKSTLVAMKLGFIYSALANTIGEVPTWSPNYPNFTKTHNRV